MSRLYGWILERLAHRFIAAIYRTMDARIKAGDLDLDDYVYDSRSAAYTLLRIWWDEDPEGQQNAERKATT
jgi:hypothetical protein